MHTTFKKLWPDHLLAYIKIPCADCVWCYVHEGETSRCFETHKKEHLRNVKTWAMDQTLQNMHGHSTIA